MQQFNAFYFKRLEQLKFAVKEAAEMKWDVRAEYVDNILDLRTGSLTVIIGTLFKLQSKKPSVFNSDGKDEINIIQTVDQVDLSFGVTGINQNQNLAGKYISDDDQCILEDSSGRITIKESDKFRINEQVTGTIIALLGVADT